jgi:hypothetical protein
LAHNIVGLQPLPHSVRSSGVCFKVLYCSFDAPKVSPARADSVAGWITVFAWITTTAASPAYLANVVQGLVIFNYPTYEPQRWHATMIMWAFIFVPVIWNLWFRRLLNTLEMIGGICHVVFFITAVVTLAVLSRRSSTEFVFNTLTHDLSGWTNPTVAWSIGLLTVAFPITG